MARFVDPQGGPIVLARPLRLVCAFALLGALASACSNEPEPNFTDVQVAAGAPITIGVSSMLEGDLASTGRALADAAELAGQDVTIDGHPVQFVEANDGCTEDGGASAAHELAGQDVVAVVGPSCSDAVIGAQPVFEEAGITHISQLSTNVKTTQPDDRAPFRTFLRTSFNDAIQGQGQAEFAEQTLGAKSVFIVYEAFRYGGAVDPFRNAWKGSFVDDVGFNDKSEFPDLTARIADENPDLVYFSGFYPTGIPFIQALRDAGYNGPVLAGDAMYDQKTIDGLGTEAEHELYITLPSPKQEGAAFDQFDSDFQDTYGSDPQGTSFTAESFDAATAIIDALQADGVMTESDGGGITVDQQALNDAIYASSFDGASGPVSFDDKGDRVAEGLSPVTVFVVQDGVFVPVTTDQ
jgi:branched-chain amino acid transport system substrate-binding protein